VFSQTAEHEHEQEKDEESVFLEKFTVCFQRLYFEAKNKNLSVSDFIIQNIAT
jgi:hypothetical protein